MTVRRMDHVGVIVDDLPAATAFFVALGLEVQGEGSVEGDWVDRIVGLEAVRSDLVFVGTPDGETRIELVKFTTPPSPGGDDDAPSNVPGLRHICFAIDDLDGTLARLQEEHGAELVGSVERYGDTIRLCYIRGPAGVIVELAERVTAPV